MHILAIETSCDETSAAVVRDGRFVLSNIVASQAAIHAKYGGVVPEVAARKHVEAIVPVIHEAMSRAGMTPAQIDLLAVTNGPGLINSLLIGIDAVKSLGYAWNKKIVPTHHIMGHMYANQILEYESRVVERNQNFVFPSICLTVSGGHTELVLLRGHGEMEVLGSTVDDAAGEAFDKVAALIGLGYPGGPAISRAAALGDRNRYELPSPMIHHDNLNFSFAGLKTAVLRLVKSLPRDEVNGATQMNTQVVQDIAASFEQAVVRVLMAKTFYAVDTHGVKKVMLSGGVAANVYLREQFAQECARRGLDFSFPPIELCTDNAAMIGAAAFFVSDRAVSYDQVLPRMGIAF